MDYILVSACLLGENCKYSGGSNSNETILKWRERLERRTGKFSFLSARR